MEEQGIIFYTATISKWQKLLEIDQNKLIIINSLNHLVKEKQLLVYGFIIMPNHIHLIWKEIIQPNITERPKARFMKFTSHSFQKNLVQKYPEKQRKFYVNKADRKYNFWQRDPLEFEIFSREVLEQKLDYIHLNPMQEKWNLVEEPEDYKYSSAKFYESGIDEFGFLTHYMTEFE